MIDAATIAANVRSGAGRATDVTREALARIRERNGAINAVTRLLEARALEEAEGVDAAVAAGRDPGPLAGVPYGVKDLFAVRGLATTAGAGMRADAPPAAEDAEAIVRMRAAGAVLVATLNMDEYAYGFATINATHGWTRNPHDETRIAGGSSGGSAAAVAAGMVPIALGSDTNGSIRVPASLTGTWGLKPTHGDLPMAGVFPFVESFDDIGPFATTLADLRLVWSVLHGRDEAATPPARVATLGGWFRSDIEGGLLEEVDAAAAKLGSTGLVELPHVDAARSAAFVMTAAEGGRLHLPALRRDAMAFDPATRDRLIAGALLPASAYVQAQRVRGWFAAEAAALFERYDLLVAPATPAVAPPFADPTITVGGARVPARAHLGLYTQPLSFIGLPVLAVPLPRAGRLPFGIQLIAAPGRDALLFEAARALAQA